jgi:hypothetical protein
MSKKGRTKKNLLDKVKDLDATFADEVFTMPDSDLKEKIVTLTKYSMEIEEARSEDQDLQSLKEQLKVCNQTYTEPLKANKLKRQLILDVLKNRGKLA